MATPLTAFLMLRFGWRYAFLAVGAIGILWLIVWWPSYRLPDTLRPAPAVSRSPLSGLVRTRFVWSFTLAKGFMDPVWYFYIFWFPEYLKNARHFDMASIGKYGWIPFLAADLGNFAGGWMSDALLRRGISVTVARKGTLTLFALLMSSAIPAVLVPTCVGPSR